MCTQASTLLEACKAPVSSAAGARLHLNSTEEGIGQDGQQVCWLILKAGSKLRPVSPHVSRGASKSMPDITVPEHLDLSEQTMCVTLQALYSKIFGFAQLPKRELAVDVATGTGQAAAVLAQTFDKASYYHHC